MKHFQFKEQVEVKMFSEGRWQWVPGIVIDPYTYPPVIDLISGQQLSPRNGRIRAVKSED